MRHTAAKRQTRNGMRAASVLAGVSMLAPGCMSYRAVVRSDQWTQGAPGHLRSGEYDVDGPLSVPGSPRPRFNVHVPLIAAAGDEPARELVNPAAAGTSTAVEFQFAESAADEALFASERSPEKRVTHTRLVVCALLRKPSADTSVSAKLTNAAAAAGGRRLSADASRVACENGQQACAAWEFDLGETPHVETLQGIDVAIEDHRGYGTYRFILSRMTRAKEDGSWTEAGLSKSEVRVVKSNGWVSFGVGLVAAAGLMVGLAVLAGH